MKIILHADSQKDRFNLSKYKQKMMTSVCVSAVLCLRATDRISSGSENKDLRGEMAKTFPAQ